MTNKKSFILFANCIPVKGYSESIIYDLQYNNYCNISNNLFDLLCINKGKYINELKPLVNNKVNNNEIDYCFDLLVNEGFGFYSNEPSLFPELDLTWKSASIITNVIIEISNHLNKNLNKIFSFIDKLGCIAVQIICNYSFLNTTWLNELLNNLANSRIKSIELILKYNDSLNINNLLELAKNHRRIYLMVLYDSNEEKKIDLLKNEGIEIIFTKQSFNIDKMSILNYQSFEINLELFTESQKHNTYFNKKLFINDKGEIKNAPECKEVFGRINDTNSITTLLKIISSKIFQKYWYVNKNIIDICKDCEFRYMCIDNRLPLKKINTEWHYITECNYNPYIAKWEGEENYITVEEWKQQNKFNTNK